MRIIFDNMITVRKLGMEIYQFGEPLDIRQGKPLPSHHPAVALGTLTWPCTQWRGVRTKILASHAGTLPLSTLKISARLVKQFCRSCVTNDRQLTCPSQYPYTASLSLLLIVNEIFKIPTTTRYQNFLPHSNDGYLARRQPLICRRCKCASKKWLAFTKERTSNMSYCHSNSDQ